MKRLVTILISSLLLYINAYSQTQNTFSLGRGTTSTYNGMLIPYNLRGCNVISLSYGNERLLKNDWKTLFDIGINKSTLRIDYNFANKLNSNQPGFLDFDVFINKSYLKQIVEVDKFTAYIGLITSAQGVYQATVYPDASFDMTKDRLTHFLQVGVSEGISSSMQLRLKKVILQNTTSYLIAGVLLYPNYSSDNPLLYNGAGRHLTLAFINKRNYIENKFKVEFPLYIKGKFINSFSISHDFKYEYSTIKDNVFRRLGHTINVGILFKTDKLNISDLK